jgi:hypothetical protein
MTMRAATTAKPFTALGCVFFYKNGTAFGIMRQTNEMKDYFSKLLKKIKPRQLLEFYMASCAIAGLILRMVLK